MLAYLPPIHENWNQGSRVLVVGAGSRLRGDASSHGHQKERKPVARIRLFGFGAKRGPAAPSHERLVEEIRGLRVEVFEPRSGDAAFPMQSQDIL